MVNKPGDGVRKPEPDRRVVRTRRALGAALVELMEARDFDDISVRQVLERARVGRATFYAHFRNKQDLLLSDAERFCEMMEARFLADPGGRRVAPVRELFAHVADVHAFRRSVEQSALREPVFGLVTAYQARTIERRLLDLCPGIEDATLPLAATARLLAGAMMEMLRWWLHRIDRPSAREMDERFHEIVWDGVGRVVPPHPR